MLMVNPKDSAAPESDDLCSDEDQLALACNVKLEFQFEDIDASWPVVNSRGGWKLRRKRCRCRSWIRERWRDLTIGIDQLQEELKNKMEKKMKPGLLLSKLTVFVTTILRQSRSSKT
ncbi:hypothetical protein HanPI659440_Chr03g0132281 [Helianthus annuus]|nr:hypothetical protein HanPI659440_Chr03g0132281 [Helianthus annuus]